MARVPEHPSPKRYFGVGFLVVLSAALLTLFLEEHPGLSQLVNLNFDAWLLSAAAKAEPDIVVVRITDEDYKEVFHAKSPLNQEIVQELIKDIMDSGAALLAVDLDTSEWNPNRLDSLPNQPIVWARAAQVASVPNLGNEDVLEKVLGGQGTGIRFGCSMFTPDVDGVTRRYELEFGSSKAPCPAFAAKVVEEARDHGFGRGNSPETSRKGENETKLINFAGGPLAFRHFASKDVMNVAGTPAWRSNNPLKKKIVLLGGSFTAARDTFLTPVGPINGVDVLAHTISSELYGTDVKEAKWWGVALDLIVGMGLVTAAWLLRRPWQMWLVLVCSFAVVFLGSWLVFRQFNFFVSFVPVVAGVFLHEVVDLRIEYGEVVRERDRLERELEARPAG